MGLKFKKEVSDVKKALLTEGFSKEVVSAILGNIEVESNFMCKTESLYYKTIDRLKAVFPSKFKGKKDDFVDDYIENEQKLGDYVYGAYGGYKYRGRGYIQITGKANYELFSKRLNLPLVDKPEMAAMPNIASLIAGDFVKLNAFPLSLKNLNDERNLLRVSTLVTMSIQGPKKDYSKGFLKKHMDLKNVASKKYFDNYDSI